MKVPPPPFAEKERFEPIIKVIKETPVIIPTEKKKVCLHKIVFVFYTYTFVKIIDDCGSFFFFRKLSDDPLETNITISCIHGWIMTFWGPEINEIMGAPSDGATL
jgi:hypothetical protein